MANTNELIPVSTLKELDDFNGKITTSAENMEKLLTDAQKLTTELIKTGNSYKSLSDIINKQNELEKKVNIEIANNTKLLDERTKWEQKIIDLQSEEVKQIEKLKIEYQNKRKEIRDTVKEQQNLAKANETVKKSLEDLQNETKEPNNFDQAETRESQLRRLNILLESSSQNIRNLKESADISGLLQESESGISSITAALNEGNSRLVQITDAQNNYKDALGAGIISHEEYKSAMSDLDVLYENTNASLEKIREEYGQTGKTIKEISSGAFDSLDIKLQQQYRTLSALQLELSGTQLSLKELDKEYKAGNITQDDYIKRRANHQVVERELKADIKSLSDEIKYNTQLVNSAVGSYENISAQYYLLKIRINQMGEAEGDNIEIKRQLEVQSKALYEQMSNLQKATGKHQLDVGKYDIAVRDLTKTISLLDPKLGVIINKIQQISPLKNAWIDINGKLAKSLNITTKAATALQIIGIIALIGAIYLGVKALQEWYDSTQKIEKGLREFNTSLENTSSTFSSQIALVSRLKLQWDSLGDSLQEKEKFIKNNKNEFNSLGLEINNVSSAEKFFRDDTERFIKSLALRAKAAAAASLAAEEYRKSILKQAEIDQKSEHGLTLWETIKARWQSFDLRSGKVGTEEEIINGYIDTLKDEKNISDDLAESYNGLEAAFLSEAAALTTGIDALNKKTNADKKRAEEIKKRAEAEKKAYEELALFEIQQRAEAQKQILNDNKRSFQDREAALNHFISNQKLSIETAAANQLKTENLTKSQIELINLKKQAELAKIDQEGAKFREQITKDYVTQQQKVLNDAYNERIRFIDSGESESFKLLSDQLAQGVISQEEYEKSKLNLSKHFAKKRFDAEVDSLRLVIDLYKSSQKEFAGTKMSELFQGNVDLLSRPLVDAAKLVEKGWEDAGEGIATVFSSQYGIIDSNGKEIEILVTPILPDGTVLSQGELEDYIDNILDGADDILAADNKGIVIAVDVDRDGKAGEQLHQLQEQYYELGETSKEVSEIEKKILDAEVKYNKSINQQKIKDDEDAAKKRLDVEKKLADERKKLLEDLYKQSFELVGALGRAETERNLQKLEQESQDNDKWREGELRKIQEKENSGVLTEQQAEAQRLIIEQQSEERENAIEERKKKIQRDQAEREKQMALLQLAVETAMAVGKIRAQAAVLAANPVTAALAAVAYAQIPIVLASAAVQATTISAQSIPEYAEGTDDHKGGRAIVGDGGRSELIITPSGEVFVTPKTPTLVDLPKHTVVLPDMEKALPLMAMTHLIDRKAQDKIVVAENKRQIQLQEENNHLLKKIAKGNPRLPKSTFITTSGNYIINKNMNYGNN